MHLLLEEVMRVLHVPADTKNPYQRLLIEALMACGVDAELGVKQVSGRSRNLFTLLPQVQAYRDVDILHLHWVGPWLGSTSSQVDRVETSWTLCLRMVRAIRFFAEICWLKLRGVKLVWTIHNLVSHDSTNTRLELFFRHTLALLSDNIIVHCPAARKQIIDSYKLHPTTRITVIPIGQYNCYENDIDQLEARKRLRISPEEKVFLFFGRVRSYKGVLQLLKAFHSLNSAGIRLLIVGQCSSQTLQDEIMSASRTDERVKTILAFIPDDHIQMLMNAADIVVLPFSETLTSSTLMLAMAYGKPIVAPRLGCIPFALEGTANPLYDPEEPDGLYLAMKQSLEIDPRIVGAKNLQLSTRFSWDKIAVETQSVYQACLVDS